MSKISLISTVVSKFEPQAPLNPPLRGRLLLLRGGLERGLIAILTIVILGCCLGCKKDKEKKENEALSPKLHIVNINTTKEDQSNFKFLMVHEDGSYAIIDHESNPEKPTVYINTSSDNAVEKGIIATLDENGFPKLIQCEGYMILCANFDGKKFDAVILHGTDEPVYFWGLEVDQGLTKQLQTKSMSLETQTHIAWGIKGIAMVAMVATTVVGVSAAIVAGAPVIAGIAIGLATVGIASYAYNLYSKGQHENITSLGEEVATAGSFVDWKNMAQKKELKLPTKWDIVSSILIDAVDEFADTWRDDIDKQHKKILEEVQKPFDYRPYQIELSTYNKEMPSEPLEDVVFVTTSSPWTIENGDNGWCFASRSSNDKITIHVVEPNTANTRSCVFRITPISGNPYIKTVYLTVTQRGNDYDISPRSLSFEAEGGQQGFTVSFSANSSTTTVESIKVIDGSSWCSVTSSLITSPIMAIVKANPNNKESSRDALIEIVFKRGELRSSTTVNVTQKGKGNETGFFVGTPFNNTMWKINEFVTTWNMNGTRRKYNINTNQYYTEPDSYTGTKNYGERYVYFKGDTLFIINSSNSNIYWGYIFKGDSIFHFADLDDGYGRVTSKYKNGVPRIYEYSDKTTSTTITRSLNNNILKITWEGERNSDYSTGYNWWHKEKGTFNQPETFEITSSNTIKYIEEDKESYTVPSYGSEYTGWINYIKTEKGTSYGNSVTTIPNLISAQKAINKTNPLRREVLNNNR